MGPILIKTAAPPGAVAPRLNARAGFARWSRCPWLELIVFTFTFQSIIDPAAATDVLRQRPYGMIEIADGALRRICLRPFPKLVSLPEISLWGRWVHRYRSGDRCRLYYNQPRRHRNFLALKYVVSNADTSFASFRLALRVLDEIARIKRTDALLCDASNLRISDRLLARWGWESHRPQRWRRNFIKRFYGAFPPPLDWDCACRARLATAVELPEKPATVRQPIPGSDELTFFQAKLESALE